MKPRTKTVALFFLLICGMHPTISRAEISERYESVQSKTIEEERVVGGIHVFIAEGMDQKEAEEWVWAIGEAIELLSRANPFIMEQIRYQQFSFPLRFIIGEEPSEWFSGNYTEMNHLIFFNQAPNPNHPFDFEYISENGFMREEKLAIAIHEMAHAFEKSSNARQDESWAAMHALYEKELPLTKYPIYSIQDRLYFCYYSGVDQTLMPLYRSEEDFAEIFSFYVLWPDTLKTLAPLRYEYLKNMFGKEYERSYPMPSSMEARLLHDRTVSRACTPAKERK